MDTRSRIPQPHLALITVLFFFTESPQTSRCSATYAADTAIVRRTGDGYETIDILDVVAASGC